MAFLRLFWEITRILYTAYTFWTVARNFWGTYVHWRTSTGLWRTDFPHRQGGGGTYLLYAKSYTSTYSIPYSQAHIFWWTRIYFESVSSKRKLDAWAFIFCTSFPYLLSRSDPNFKRGKGKDTDMGAAYYFWLYDWLFSFETPLLDI